MFYEDLSTGYVFECFERFDYSNKDRLLEYSVDGKHIFVETLPSPLVPWRATARRWELKYKIPTKEANFAAYRLWYVAGKQILKEIRDWYENLVSSCGWEIAIQTLDEYYRELFKVENHEDVSFETAYMEAVEEVCEESPSFRALPLYDDDKEGWKLDPLDELIYEWKRKIWRCGVGQISEVGKRLYVWSKRPDIKVKFSNEQISSLWRTFYATKERLRPFFERQRKKKNDNDLEELSLF